MRVSRSECRWKRNEVLRLDSRTTPKFTVCRDEDEARKTIKK